MKIYDYNPKTCVFIDESEADPNPMEPGEFLVPAFSTSVPVPAPEAGKVAVFDPANELWSLVDAEKAPAEPEPTPIAFSVKAQSWRAVVKAYADVVAQAFDFDDMAEAVTYADEPAVPKFQVLGAALRAWRSILWAAFDDACAQISAGHQPEPTSDAELLSLLPDFTSPDVSSIGVEPYAARNAKEAS